jgi:hypothetical protein
LTPLSGSVASVARIFSPKKRIAVATILETECGDNLLLEGPDSAHLKRCPSSLLLS